MPNPLDAGDIPVRLDEVGEQGQAARGVARTLVHALFGHGVIAVGLIVLLGLRASQADGLAVDIVVDISEVTRVAPQPEPIAARQAIEARLPGQLTYSQVAAGA
ncbi:hypothetical protein D3C75_1128460 [compost metagenome]